MHSVLYEIILRMLESFRQRLFGKSASPTGDRAERGRFGEREAGKFLKKQKGHRILVRNWRAGKDEIDLVTKSGDVIVFVEVRSRQSTAKVSGYSSVTQAKKKCLLRVCQAYLRALRPRPAHFRFDIVEVRLGNDGEFSIHHFENVPLFPKNN
ncbi:MAG: YraN family protein [Verrucomicrobiota bacterium]